MLSKLIAIFALMTLTYDLVLDLMILMLKLDIEPIKIYIHIKNEASR